jgi:CheY-like chemotaxis protein
MSPKNKPHILIVDDQPDMYARALKTEIANKAIVDIASPEDITEIVQITKADLILVDYLLDEWQSRDEVGSLCQRPMDGLALASVLRSHADGDRNSSPTAIAILSAHRDELSGGLPSEPRAHAIARAHNLEWAFSKANPHGKIALAHQIVFLANSVRELPPVWFTDNLRESELQVQKLFGLSSNTVWFSKAWEEILECHPPIHELSKWSHGLAILRWMLHRILPYPCFLIDSYQLAARLRVTHESLERVLAGSNKLSQLFGQVKYKGMLSNFLGMRWWRAGVESVLWQVTDGKSFDPEVTKVTLKKLSGQLKFTTLLQPVVGVDIDYQPIEDLLEISQSVRIQPDDWPPYADQAWTSIELAKQEHQIRALVLRQDQTKLH